MLPQTALISTIVATTLPLAVCATILIGTRRFGKLSAAISIAAATISLTGAGWLFMANRDMSAPLHITGNWLVSGDISVIFGYLLDPLSLVMLLVVAAISFLVQLYSWGYMAQDPGLARYYAFLSLFAWAMLNLTVAAAVLQLYVFWELVGLSSYLLIGFWYEKFSASQAGKKAFVMTRLGDIFFFFGILLLVIHFGQLDIAQLNHLDPAGQISPAMITAATLLILGGVIGKSAQFPLLTWLPDAMEGPTPVSALLHSATMVAAGVYLTARLFPLFSLSPTTLAVCLLVGTLSMLSASTMALVARDIKQVWAFSTISQLGYMLMALGAGGYTAGIFHLTTHAGFKALLFLCSGVFLHTFATNDMFAIGRAGGRGLKIPIFCMIVGAAALAGLPPFSGFFSKEMVLAQLAGLSNPIWLWVGLLGAFLTAYYAFRLIFVIVFPERDPLRTDAAHEEGFHAATHDGGHGMHGHHHSGAAGEYAAMAAPLVILALVTILLGFSHDWFSSFLVGGVHETHVGGHPGWLPYVEIGGALFGILLAFFEFGRRGAPRVGFVERLPLLADFFAQRWYLDHVYRWLVDHVLDRGFSRLCALGDRNVIDKSLDGLADGTIFSGHRLSDLQSGIIQAKLAVIFAAVLLLAVYVIVP